MVLSGVRAGPGNQIPSVQSSAFTPLDHNGAASDKGGPPAVGSGARTPLTGSAGVSGSGTCFAIRMNIFASHCNYRSETLTAGGWRGRGIGVGIRSRVGSPAAAHLPWGCAVRRGRPLRGACGKPRRNPGLDGASPPSSRSNEAVDQAGVGRAPAPAPRKEASPTGRAGPRRRGKARQAPHPGRFQRQRRDVDHAEIRRRPGSAWAAAAPTARGRLAPRASRSRRRKPRGRLLRCLRHAAARSAMRAGALEGPNTSVSPGAGDAPRVVAHGQPDEAAASSPRPDRGDHRSRQSGAALSAPVRPVSRNVGELARSSASSGGGGLA